MKIIRGLHNLQKQTGSVVTIGNFDGVHLGHQALFREVVGLASERGAHSVALTFDPQAE